MRYLATYRYKNLKGKAHIVQTSRGIFVMAETHDGFSDWPIQYWDGKIAYNHPERIPKYLKRLVGKAFKNRRMVIQGRWCKILT